MSVILNTVRGHLPALAYACERFTGFKDPIDLEFFQVSKVPTTPPKFEVAAKAPEKSFLAGCAAKVEKFVKRLEHNTALPIRDCFFERTDIEMLIIPGGSAGTARALATSWVKANPKREVTFIVRSKKDVLEIKALQGRDHWIVLSDFGYKDKKTLHKTLDVTFKDLNISKIAMVCCVGSAILSGSQTFAEVNISPVINTSKAILKYSKATSVKDITLINISSIAASIIDPEKCSYVKSRVRADQDLLALARRKRIKDPELTLKALSLRPGMIKSAFEPSGDFCPWDMEQFVNMPFLIVPGSGKQEIPVLDVDDLVDVILNCVDSKEQLSEIIDAITQHRVTYNEIMEMYLNRRNRNIPKVYIPLGVMQEVSNTIPYGKIAPYSGMLFEVMDHKEVPAISHKRFEELLGRPSKSIEDIYPKGQKYVFHVPPIKEHALDALEKAKLKPEIVLTLTLAMAKGAPYVAARTLLGRAPPKQEGRSTFAIKPEAPAKC